MQTKSKIILCIVFIILFIISCVECYFFGKCGRKKPNDIDERYEKIINELKRENEEKQRIIDSLEQTNRNINSSIKCIDKCSEILGECKERVESSEDSLDGLAECINIYEDTIRRLSKELGERNKIIGEQ